MHHYVEDMSAGKDEAVGSRGCSKDCLDMISFPVQQKNDSKMKCCEA